MQGMETCRTKEYVVVRWLSVSLVFLLLLAVAGESLRPSHLSLTAWIPINPSLFWVCLVLLSIEAIVGFASIGMYFHRSSRTRGEFHLKMFVLNLVLLLPCIRVWVRWSSEETQGDAASVGALICFFVVAASIFVLVFVIFGVIGMLSSNTSASYGNVTTTTRYMCPHCGVGIKPFDFPLRGRGTCRACNRVFNVPDSGILGMY